MKPRDIKFFLVPGFHSKATDGSYRWLVEFLEQSGFDVVKVPVDWKYNVLSKNAAEFIEFYEKHKASQNYVLGFSYGALITFITAHRIKPNKIFLCSVSPFFKEDAAWNKQWIHYVGKRRYQDSLTRSAKELARKTSTDSVLFYGEAEARRFPALSKRITQIAENLENCKLVVIQNAPHKIDFPEYVTAIKKEISTL